MRRKDLKVNNTNILPLRWFANMCGEIAGWAIMRAAYLDEEKDFGLKYSLYGKIYSLTWPTYMKFGSFYEFDFDMSGDGWNDYDSDGIPYWEKTGAVDPDYYINWDYEDPETGDAFRIKR
ncbi:MAG: hypothetical protein ACO3CQ_04875 [Candidatus Nanopelagicaceae bacterium]